VLGQLHASRALQQSVTGWQPVTAQVLFHARQQVRKVGGQLSVAPGLASRPPGGLYEPGPAVAQRDVAELGQLPLVGDASSQGLLRTPLPLGVGERQGGELLSTGQARGAVAP
jgi:hypothetical protein